MDRFSSEYQALSPYDGEEEEEEEDETDENDLPVIEQDVLIHVNQDGTKGNYNHIQDLDDFFTRVYSYLQKGGFLCMILDEICQLLRFIFIAMVAFFMSHCVDYPMLFHDKLFNESDPTHKVSLAEAFLPSDQCFQGLFATWWMGCLFIMFICFFFFYVVKFVVNAYKYNYIRNFYINALKITPSDLPNMTWHEVQARLLEVQKEHQMCVHKRELTQLDIYHRILRFKNYLVAMVNVNTLPLKHNLPFIGEYAYLSTALRFNLDCILFWHWCSGAPFENNWHLRNEFRNPRNKAQATQNLERRILWFGMINLIFSPLIFVWNCLYCFFRYAELMKRNPSVLGTRRWSNYSRLYLRHFNELDHELNARLNKGYKPVSDYLNIFTSPAAVIVAKNLMFMAGALLAVLVVLTVIDEDVLNVEHVFMIITILGVVVAACNSVIPDEHMVHSPELLLRNVAMTIHYMPEKWAGFAHTSQIRDAFSMLFQYRIVYIVEELLSPIITPFILLLCVRPRAAQIVDFLRMFTVEVVGVGDICSFAQMDVRKHGNSKWQFQGQTTQSSPPKNHQAENGKTEMSLMHFHMTNPEWKPDPEGGVFINNLRSQVQRDMQSRSLMMTTTVEGGQHSMFSPSITLPSLVPSLVPLQPVGPYTSMMSSLSGPLLPPTSNSQAHNVRLRGAVSQLEGPAARPAHCSLFGSMHSTSDSAGGLGDGVSVHTSLSRRAVRQVDECTRELMGNEMNINALYMHELRWRRGTNDYLSLDDYQRNLWQSPDGSTVAGSASTSSSSALPPPMGAQASPPGLMPDITEEGSAEDEREVDTSLMMSPPPSTLLAPSLQDHHLPS